MVVFFSVFVMRHKWGWTLCTAQGNRKNKHLPFVYIRLPLNLFVLVHFQMAELDVEKNKK